MKTTILKTTLTAMTIALLSQPMFANDTASKEQVLHTYLEKASQDGAKTLDVAEFAALWDKAGNRSGSDHLTNKMADMVDKAKTEDECYHATDERKQDNVSSRQKLLEKYLEKASKDGAKTLDVAEFAALWEKAGNRDGSDHLTNKMADMVDKAKTEDECYHATDDRKEK